MHESNLAFAASVIIASDYEEGNEKTWETERKILTALAKQDFKEPFEIILVDYKIYQESLPKDLSDILPNLKIIFSNDAESAKRKDYGVKFSTSELVAVLEADCIPCSSWLRILVEDLRTLPDMVAVSGRTTYGDDSIYKRALSLLDRSFDDLGNAGKTQFVSNNGALYRRHILEAFPYPEAITPFLSSRTRNQAILDAGYQFYFDPRVSMQHAIGGWEFIKDVRRNTGYSDMMELAATPSLNEVPRLLMKRQKFEWSLYKRLGRKRLKWYDWPLAIVLLFVARWCEVPGMIDAVKGNQSIPNTAYR
ncbi:MAG: glycosyltransferase [Leptolyngbyaceae cyanobacterium bins.302]|nr:glycosyltransferase [Leptolyngbyaceae cyanobacterium bins.302]